MRLAIFFLLSFLSSQMSAQLGFCEGSKGDPIFHEDFGQGTSSGPALPPGTTNYTYVTGDPQDGEYTVSDDIGNGINSWHSYLPSNTISDGRALIVNADFASGQFYRTEISGLCPNTTYEFSAYLLNTYNRANPVCGNGGIPVNVRFQIWDETDSILLKEGSTGDIHSTTTPQWEQYALTFQSQVGQNAIILKMFNNGAGGCGNDLAIDDIIFRSCGDLTTLTQQGTTSNRLNVCEENAPVNITLEATPDYSVYTQHFFQWQESSDKQSWSNIPGETGSTYTATNLSSSRYYRVKVAEDPGNLINNLCSSASEAFHVNIIKTPKAPVSHGDEAICSNEDYPELAVDVKADETVNWYDAPTGGNLLAENTSTFIPQEEGIFYAEAVKTDYSCEPGGRTAIAVTVLPTPVAEDEVAFLCPDATVTLTAGMLNLNYSWSTGEHSEAIEVSAEGTYSVEITNSFGCSSIKSFEVIAVDAPVILEIISEERGVTIVPEEEGIFQYSLDGINFQESKVFEPVSGGIYTAYMRDRNNCTLVTREFAHLVIPGFITPNNDGYNDFFELKGVSFLGTSEIRIFDRYGKLLKSGPGENFKWDGTVNGKLLPQEDYWYDIYIEGFENKRGNFSLLR